jgi:hypothetical protein
MNNARALVQVYGWLTNFEFEQTRYRTYASRDVNSYTAVTIDGKVKSKGGFGTSGLQTNPANDVVKLAAHAHIASGVDPADFIINHLSVENFKDFTQSRSVTGGAVFSPGVMLVDDWVEAGPGQWKRPHLDKIVSRKSRPHPVEVPLIEGDPLGRVARWYYSTDKNRSLRSVKSGNLVPKSESAMPCMELPDYIPDDLDVRAYIDECWELLATCSIYK